MNLYRPAATFLSLVCMIGTARPTPVHPLPRSHTNEPALQEIGKNSLEQTIDTILNLMHMNNLPGAEIYMMGIEKDAVDPDNCRGVLNKIADNAFGKAEISISGRLIAEFRPDSFRLKVYDRSTFEELDPCRQARTTLPNP